MVVAKIVGGLGNQMFIYAAARSLSHKLDCDLGLDISSYTKSDFRNYELNSVFGINKHLKQNLLTSNLSKIISRFRGHKSIKIVNQKNFFDIKQIQKNQDLLVDDYFQNDMYFKPISKQIKNEFTFVRSLDARNHELSQRLKTSNSLSIHIRRTDYVTNPKAVQLLGTLDLDYYKKAIKYIGSKVNNLSFFVFSDDIDWCKKNLKLGSANVEYINHNTGLNSYVDMHLMSLCQHNIIANSSFSWWGAWLNQNKGKIVVAPQKWYRDPNTNKNNPAADSWVKL